MITYRAYKPLKYLTTDTYIQKIRINKKLKTVTILDECKIDNDTINLCDNNEIKKHLKKDFFDFCKGRLHFGQRKRYYYISTTDGLKLIKNGYVVNVDGVRFGFVKNNNVYTITDILTGCVIDVLPNLWAVYTNLQNLKNKRNRIDEQRLKKLEKNFKKARGLQK